MGQKEHEGKVTDPKRAQSGKTKEPVRTVFVGGLSPGTPEAKARECFGGFGEVGSTEPLVDNRTNKWHGLRFVPFKGEEPVRKIREK